MQKLVVSSDLRFFTAALRSLALSYVRPEVVATQIHEAEFCMGRRLQAWHPKQRQAVCPMSLLGGYNAIRLMFFILQTGSHSTVSAHMLIVLSIVRIWLAFCDR